MKTKKILFAVFTLVCVMAMSVSLSSCSKSSDDEGTVVYTMGFSQMEYSGVSSSGASLTGMTEEMSKISSTFMNQLGVSSETFQNYPGGDDAVISKCNSAAAILNSESFNGTYVYGVQRVSGKGQSTIFTWSSK